MRGLRKQQASSDGRATTKALSRPAGMREQGCRGTPAPSTQNEPHTKPKLHNGLNLGMHMHTAHSASLPPPLAHAAPVGDLTRRVRGQIHDMTLQYLNWTIPI